MDGIRRSGLSPNRPLIIPFSLGNDLVFQVFKTGVEFISTLGNYVRFQSSPSFKFVSLTFTSIRDGVDAASSLSDLRAVASKIKKSLSQSDWETCIFSHIPSALIAFNDFQFFFNGFQSDLKVLPLPRPLSLARRAVQTKIPSLALLIAGIGYGLANMLSSFKQLNNTDYKSTPLKLQIVADAAFMMYNAFQYRSSTPGWVKFGCLALSTGSKIMSKYYASGERLPPALPLTFTDWYTNALDENLRHILIEFACTATYKLEEATEDLFNYISRGDNLHKLIFSLVLAGMLKKAEEDTRMKGPIAKFLTIDVQIVSTVPHDKIARLLEDIEQANEIHPKTFLRKVITRFLDIRHAQMDQAGLTRIIQELQGINWTQDHETRGNEPDA